MPQRPQSSDFFRKLFALNPASTNNVENCAAGFHRGEPGALTSVSSNGAKETRTPDPLHAMQVLYQLSYGPVGID